jgi:hypothetical protein
MGGHRAGHACARACRCNRAKQSYRVIEIFVGASLLPTPDRMGEALRLTIGLDLGGSWTAALSFDDATTALQKERRPVENASPQTAQSLLTTDGTSAYPNRGGTSRARLKETTLVGHVKVSGKASRSIGQTRYGGPSLVVTIMTALSVGRLGSVGDIAPSQSAILRLDICSRRVGGIEIISALMLNDLASKFAKTQNCSAQAEQCLGLS